MPKKKTLSEKLPLFLFFFFCVCVCVCNIVSSMRHEWQHLPLFTTYSTNSTNNERSWGVPPRCVRVYNKCEKKKKRWSLFFCFPFRVRGKRTLTTRPLFFFTVSSFNSLYFVQCFALFFFFRKCVQKSTAVVPSWWLCSSKNRCRVHHVQLFFLSLFFPFLRIETKKKIKNKTKWRESTYKKKKEGELIIVVENNRWTTQSFRRLQPPTHAHRHECSPPHITAYTSCQHCTLWRAFAWSEQRTLTHAPTYTEASTQLHVRWEHERDEKKKRKWLGIQCKHK